MALAGLLLFVAGLCLGPVQETDLFFRIASGAELLRTGRVVHRNLFSFTFPDAPYRDPAWLFDGAVAGLFRLGGFPAVVMAKTALLVLLATVAFRLCRRREAGVFATTQTLAFAFACMRERLVERPHVLSLLGEVAVLGMLPAVERGSRRAWLLLPLVALWANLHAGAFVAAFLLALAAAGTLLDRKPVRVGLRFIMFAALTGLALLATPVGTGIASYLFFHIGVFNLHPVDEFRGATWRSDAPSMLLALGGLIVLAFARRKLWQEILPALGLLALAAWHVRFGADAILVLAVIVAPALSKRVPVLLDSRPAHIALFAGLVLSALGPRLAQASRGENPLALGLDESALPLDAIRFVEAHGLRERMYNDFEIGSYLIWQGYPRFRVFVDPRLPAYPTDFHRLLGRMDIARAEWTRAMDGLGVESALLAYAGINRRVAFWDPEQWALVFRAKDSRVFVRRLPRWSALIAALEIPASFDFTVENGAVTLPILAPPKLSPVAPCEWDLRLADLYFDLDGKGSDRAIAAYRSALAAPAGCLSPEHELSAASWIGSLDTAAGRFGQALPLLDRALAIAPDDTAVLTNRALTLAGLGRASEAKDAWMRVSTLAGGSELGARAQEMARRPP